jgi:hypothetical protein
MTPASADGIGDTGLTAEWVFGDEGRRVSDRAGQIHLHRTMLDFWKRHL